MNKRLQIHVLENIRDNGQWTWGWKREILYNSEAVRRFEESPFTDQAYLVCMAMLVESGKVVEHRDHDLGTRYSPLCLTVDGLQYLSDVKRPVRQWLVRNWFAAVIASATIATSVFGIIVGLVN